MRYPDVTHDAVVIIPGVMGSALVDTPTGQVLWGLDRLGWYRQAWTSGRSLRALADLDPGRIKATGLLRFPAWAPLSAFEPYTALVRAIRSVTAHPAAVLEFAYDWRLPVLDNAWRLAGAARAHLDSWRKHPDQDRARAVQPDNRPAQLVLVAHSMGGLVARALSLVEGSAEIPVITPEIRASVTLGTPFRGAAKMAVVLGTGQGVPLPKRRLARLARQLPGLYDLLPVYRCVDTGDDVRHLTGDDIAALGGDQALVRRALDFHRRLAGAPLVGHRALVGVQQPTVSLLRLNGSVVEGLAHTVDVHSDGTLVRDRDSALVHRLSTGDGTVPDCSADLPDIAGQPLAQQHGALGHVDEVITFVRWVLTRQRPSGQLGAAERLGISAPDVVAPSEECRIEVSDVDGPLAASCQIVDAETGTLVDQPALVRRDGRWQFVTRLPQEHLYRVSVTAGGATPITRMVLATNPQTGNEDD